MNVKKMVQIIIKGKHPRYNAACPYCQRFTMKYLGQHGAMDEYKCQSCGQPLLYAGPMGQTRYVERQAVTAATLGRNKDFSLSGFLRR